MITSPFDRTQIEEALACKGGAMRAVIDSLPDFIFVKDRDLRYLGVNKAFADILGLADPQEAAGKTDSDFLQPDDARKFREDDAQVIESGHAVYARERLLAVTGRDAIWLSEHRIPLSDAKGRVVGLVGVARDISSVKTMEKELRNANMRLSGTLQALKQTQQKIIQNERLNALGEMASGIAHDFNNALMPILGYSDVLITKPQILENKEEALAMIKDIRMAAMDASQAIRRLREFYRTGADDELAVGDLNKQIKTAIVLTRPKWDAEMGAKGVRVRIETDLVHIPPVNAKESQLREVLLNLILNAVDAMPRGGAITMRTRLENERVVLQVADTGGGMTDEVKRRCFEPFFTTKGEGGTGLGLALTYGFVQRHKGTIDIESAPGKGTTVTIRLPCQRKGEPASEELAALAAAPVRSLRVLIIDDELPARKLLARFLARDQHTVETAEGGHAGLEKFHHGQFDLVITDRAMPDMSGGQVAAVIRKTNPAVPIIMVTGFGDIMNEDGERPPGIDLILSKPITLEALQAGLARVMAAGSASANPSC